MTDPDIRDVFRVLVAWSRELHQELTRAYSVAAQESAPPPDRFVRPTSTSDGVEGCFCNAVEMPPCSWCTGDDDEGGGK